MIIDNDFWTRKLSQLTLDELLLINDRLDELLTQRQEQRANGGPD